MSEPTEPLPARDIPRVNSHPPPNPTSQPPTITNEELDSDEWEYEYSTTETETYYLTLDLSAPSLQTRRSQPKPNRGGKVTSWVNPSLGRPRNTFSLHNIPHKITAPGADDPEEPSASQSKQDSPVAEDENAEASFTPRTRIRAKRAPYKVTSTAQDDEEEEQEADDIDAAEEQAHKKAAEGKSLKSVQILELHSENPVVAYNDHIFTCQWSQNIGTELLLTDHDAEDALPSLRRLPGNVDLLSASSARLVGTLSNLVPKFSSERQQLSPTKRARPTNFESPGTEVAESGHSQSKFLEKFMQLKRAKGESDGVTVIAQKRMTGHGWRAVRKTARDEERVQLIAAVERGVGAEEARRRLDILDAEERGEAPVYGIDGKRKPGRKRKGVERVVEGLRGASRRGGRPRGPRGGAAIRRYIENARQQADSGGSTPTPARWGDEGFESVTDSLDSPMPDVAEDE